MLRMQEVNIELGLKLSKSKSIEIGYWSFSLHVKYMMVRQKDLSKPLQQHTSEERRLQLWACIDEMYFSRVFDKVSQDMLFRH